MSKEGPSHKDHPLLLLAAQTIKDPPPPREDENENENDDDQNTTINNNKKTRRLHLRYLNMMNQAEYIRSPLNHQTNDVIAIKRQNLWCHFLHRHCSGSLTHLELFGCGINNKGLKVIGEAVGSTLQVLGLGGSGRPRQVGINCLYK